MRAYLDEAFFEAVREDLQRYSLDAEQAIERSKMLERREQKRVINQEKSYEILEHFGAIM